MTESDDSNLAATMEKRFFDEHNHRTISSQDHEAPHHSDLHRRPREYDDHAYTRQYFTIARQGHTRPTPTFGSPTLYWHVAYWPRSKDDPQDVQVLEDGPSGKKMRTHENVRAEFEKRRKEGVDDLNELLKHLQERGRLPRGEGVERDEKFDLDDPLDHRCREPQLLKVLNTDSIGFTLWWPDSSALEPLAKNMGATPFPTAVENKSPPVTHLRVRVQVEVHPDYHSISFYVDAGKPWDQDRIAFYPKGANPDFLESGRRKRIFEAVNAVRDICEARFDTKKIDVPIFPEPSDIDPTKAERLLGAADLLYEHIWDEFCRDFGFDIVDIAGETGKVFANFRGLVMATRGADTATDWTDKSKKHTIKNKVEEAELPQWQKAQMGGAPELSPLPVFGDNPRLGDNEPRAVIKAYWPFLRRIRPGADDRDWTACGMFSWRALFATSLGSQSEHDPRDEGDEGNKVGKGENAGEGNEGSREVALTSENGSERLKATTYGVPSNFLPSRRTRQRQDEAGTRTHTWFGTFYQEGDNAAGASARNKWRKDARRHAPTTTKHDRPAPFREFLLTKYEPHPRQIGRLVDRLNTCGTLRLYTFKNWSIIRDASTQIRMYGQELDGALEDWTDHLETRQEEFNKEFQDRIPAAEKEIRQLIQKLDRVSKWYWIRGQFVPSKTLQREARERFCRYACLASGDPTTSYFVKPPSNSAGPASGSVSDIDHVHFENMLQDLRQFFSEVAHSSKTTQGRIDWRSWDRRRAEIARTEIEAIIQRYSLRKSILDRDLAELNQEAERNLIRINSGLNEIGKGSMG